jgi:WD40 repeat protein
MTKRAMTFSVTSVRRSQTFAKVGSLSQSCAATNWSRPSKGRQKGTVQNPITEIRRWTLCLFLVGCLLNGCAPKKPPGPTLTPREVKTNVERLSLVRFSPDGKQLAAGSTKGDLLVWQDLSDPPVKLESGQTSPLLSLMWSWDGLVTVTDLNRGFVGWQIDQSKSNRVELPGLPSAAVCVAFRPNARSLEFVLGMRDGSLICVDGNGSQQLKPDHRGAVKQALYSSDGKWLVTAGADGQLIWRDAATRGIAQAVKAHNTEISRLLLSEDGRQLISGDWNGGLQVWDMTARKSQREFHQAEAVSGLGWVRQELVSASWDGSLHGWNPSSGRCLRTFATGQPIHDLTCDSATSRVVTVSLDRMVRVWNWPDSVSQ